jgi:hypothetical protein
MQWLYAYGDPTVTVDLSNLPWPLNVLPLGGMLTWLKVIALIALVCWLGSWLLSGFKERVIKGPIPTILLGLVIGLSLVGVLLGRFEEADRIPKLVLQGQSVPALMGIVSLVLFVIWVELILWPTILKLGTTLDVMTLIGVHVALALGFLVATQVLGGGLSGPALVLGASLASTYMGYVVLLRLGGQLIRELFALRGRRVRALAQLSLLESLRKMWAPWVVLVLFVVVLAFTHWFLAPPPAELGRMYVGTLMLFISLVLMAMVVILTPISLPTDIQSQTIYTVVSKPVRRLEMIWGRIVGYMALVTVLLLVFGLGSLVYIERAVSVQIAETTEQLRKARDADQRERIRTLEDTLAQLNARRSARLPIKGSLMFEDSLGKKTPKGIDVGQELEYRSFVEGATPSRAIWRYGVVMDPYDELFPDPKRTPLPPLDRRVPVEDLLRRNTIEWYENQAAERVYQAVDLQNRRAAGQLSPTELQTATSRITQLEQEANDLRGQAENLKNQENELRAKLRDLQASGKANEAAALRQQIQELHSPDVELQMTLNVYRTTKGQIGEPVYASIRVLDFNDENRRLASDVIPIREYYTNSWKFPASALVGSRGYLKIEVKCISPTQYLGMAESDLYILADSGSFRVNYLKGLFGVWLQAMVLTAVGVFAGTFLSWPVALLLTIFFFLFGQILYSFLQAIALQSILGGGPFESFIRMLSHSNQMTELTPTLPVVIAKALDSVVMPILSRLVYIIPNLPALDVSTKVADGFAVEWSDLRDKFLMALGYAVPFSIAGFFSLKQREVAA